jgi:putative ubiquitin-RnfH superfamily antitoxin RatB of RatAB toxin-antitoxin module
MRHQAKTSHRCERAIRSSPALNNAPVDGISNDPTSVVATRDDVMDRKRVELTKRVSHDPKVAARRLSV